MMFDRGIRENSIEKAKDGLWNARIGEKIIQCSYSKTKQFQICIRKNYFNIYWRGCSVLKFSPTARKHLYCIHYKYVEGCEKPKNNPYVDLVLSPGKNDLIHEKSKWSFCENIIDPASERGVIKAVTEYPGKRKANGLSSGEKELLSEYLDKQSPPKWLDLEIAFSRQNEKGKNVADRIDLADLVIENGNNIPHLRLMEVKAVSDSRLRAKDGNPKIFGQMVRYKRFIDEQKDAIQQSYRKIADNMLELDLAQIDPDLLRKFKDNGQISPMPYLLILGDINELRKGNYGDHYENLCKWMEKEGYPEPIIFP